jgi:hypothetical protein
MRRNAVWCDGTPDDGYFRRALTTPVPRAFHSGGMDEPTHANESRFWDDVADWILDAADDESDVLDDIESMLRDLRDDLDAA